MRSLTVEMDVVVRHNNVHLRSIKMDVLQTQKRKAISKEELWGISKKPKIGEYEFVDTPLPLAECSTSSPYVAVVKSLHTFRLIKIYVAESRIYICHCTEATMFDYLKNLTILSPMVVFGKPKANAASIRNYIRTLGLGQIKEVKVCEENISYYSDMQYITHILKSRCGIDTVKHFDILYNLSFYRRASMCSSMADQFCNTNKKLLQIAQHCAKTPRAKSYIESLLRAPPQDDVADSIRRVVNFFSTQVGTFCSPVKNLSAYISLLQKGKIQRPIIIEMRKFLIHALDFMNNEKMQKILEDVQCIVMHSTGRSSNVSKDKLRETITQTIQHFSLVESKTVMHNYKCAPDDVVFWKSTSDIVDEMYLNSQERSTFTLQREELAEHRKNVTQKLRNLEKSVSDNRYVKLVDCKERRALALLDADGCRSFDMPDAVLISLSKYYFAVRSATLASEQLWDQICQAFDKEAVELAWYWCVIPLALYEHAVTALRKAWTKPNLHDFNDAYDQKWKLTVKNMWPYWIEQKKFCSNYCLELHNNVVMLTGENQSGKSTFLRSLTAVSQLANCGLMAPCENGTIIPRYDRIIIYVPMHDLTEEGKGSLACEAEHIKMIVDICTEKSLVLVDGLCSATQYGNRFVVAKSFLESMSRKRVSVVFATHMHELAHIKNFPIQFWKLTKTLTSDRMQPILYTLADGLSTVSGAQEVYSNAGLQFPFDGYATDCIDNKQQHTEHASDRERIADAECNVAKTQQICYQPMQLQANEQQIVAIMKQAVCGEEKLLSSSSSHLCITFQQEIFTERVISVDVNEVPPANLVGRHYIYVRIDVTSIANYGGETDNVHRRIDEHRERHPTRAFKFLVVQVENKTIALRVQTRVINSIRCAGLVLDSDKDGTHRNGEW